MQLTTRPGVDSDAYALSGRFTFADHAIVTAIQNDLHEPTNSSRCVLDISDVEFIDSSGLGMLLLLRDTATEKGSEIVLRKPREKVMKVFRACKYDALFTIEE
jgi:anti-anti-sigma factor